MTEIKTATSHLAAAALAALVVAGLSLAMMAYQGMSDLQIFLQWASVLAAHDPVAGYRLIADYPPLGPVFIWLAVAAGQVVSLPNLVGLKLGIGVFQLAGAAVAAARLRSLSAGALLWLLVAPYGSLLGYIDSFYLPFVLLAVFALETGAFEIAGAMLAVAIMIKWQPAILAPPMLIYALAQARGWRRIICVLPGAAIGLAVVMVFGPSWVWFAFSGATNDPYFSGQAFNLDWIMSAALEYWHMAGAPAITSGTIVAITALAPPWYALSKILFWAAYLAVLAVFGFAAKTPARLYLALCACESVQFTFNTGVHENHAFLLLVFVFAAVRAGALAAFYLLAVAVLALSNVLLFYGLDLVHGRLASIGTVLLSGLDVVICVALICLLLRACLRDETRPVPQS
jgi:hypothetical protein